MVRTNKHSDTVFCDDNQLSYEKFRTEFIDGQELTFDDAYRLAHLPLVAPDHPLVISTKPGTSYNRGVHDSVYSIAIPIPIDELLSSYVVGLFNFVEELNADETQDLKNILEYWWDIDIVLLQFENLWLLKSKDDLVLNGSIEQLIPMV